MPRKGAQRGTSSAASTENVSMISGVRCGAEVVGDLKRRDVVQLRWKVPMWQLEAPALLQDSRQSSREGHVGGRISYLPPCATLRRFVFHRD